MNTLAIEVHKLTLTGDPGVSVSVSDTVNISSITLEGGLKAAPSFGQLSIPQVTDGAPTTLLSGIIRAGALVPAGVVTVTVNGTSRNASIGPTGIFTVAFPTASLAVGAHNINYHFAGSETFEAAETDAFLDVTYGLLILTDLSKAKKAGSTIPVQIQLATASGANVSAATAILTAARIASESSPDQVMTLQAAGKSNPGNVFQFVGGTNPFYQFNLQTKSLAAGKYLLYFSVTGDPLEHWVEFTLK